MADIDPQALAEKISRLPSDRIAEVDDFVDFLRQREADHGLRSAAREASLPSLALIWNNPEDDVYDAA